MRGEHADSTGRRRMATAGDDAAIADFETRFAREYVRPGHVFEAVRRSVLGRRKGYVVLDGPLGAGKSFALRGLATEGLGAVPIIAVTLPQHERFEREDFLRVLTDEARGRWSVELDVPAFRLMAGAAAPFAAFLHGLMRAAGLDRLVLSVDGFDDPGASAATWGVFACLPPAHRLPDGCFIVLSVGPEPEELLGRILEQVRASTAPFPDGPDGERETSCYDTVTLSAESAGQRAAIRAYLEGHLPERFRTSEHVGAVLDHTGGLFLNAYLVCQALHEGLFAGSDDLPPAP